MKDQVVLQPGIYANSRRAARTLIAVKGGLCIYTFENVAPLVEDMNDGGARGGDRIPASTCTWRTFVRAVGKKPTRAFSPEESQFLCGRMAASKSYRRCSRRERALFVPDRVAAKANATEADSMRTATEPASAPVADGQVLNADDRDALGRAKSLRERLMSALARGLECVRQVLKSVLGRHAPRRAAA